MRPTLRSKADWLIQNKKIKLDYETKRSVSFSVESNGVKTVRYDKTRDKWTCTCMNYSIKGNMCSHILACKEGLC